MHYFKTIMLFWLIFSTSSIFASTTLYEDAEDGSTNGWVVYSNNPPGATIQNVYDTDIKSRVIQTNGSLTRNGYMLGDYRLSSKNWRNSTQKIISWKMKFSENYVVYIRVKTKYWNGYIYYTAAANNRGTSSGGTYVHHGLGLGSRNGSWQTFTRDLEADLKEFQPNNEILEVHGFLMRGSGRVDDIELKVKDTPTNFTCANPKDFDIVYTTNNYGDIRLIGNTNICKKNTKGECIDPGKATNNSIRAQYKDGDSNQNTKNSSAARLNIPKGAEILWAGMYWQGYFQKGRGGEELPDSTKAKSYHIKLGYTKEKGKQSVDYLSLSNTNLNWIYFDDERWYFQGFKEVTDFVKKNGAGWYWGADINLQVGTKVGGGSLGAWGIAIAYKDPNESMKNLTIYQGYKAFAGSTDQRNSRKYAQNHNCLSTPLGTGLSGDTSFILSGFKTPKSGEVKSNLIFFGGEGDIQYTGDGLSITNKVGIPIPLHNGTNPKTNLMNSSITYHGKHLTETDLYPRYGYNTIGIDIDSFAVGGNGANIIGNDQSETAVRMYSSGDGYFPGGFGMSTELYTPKLCYDYAVRMGDHIKIPSKNNDINTSYWQGEPLVLKIFIHNLESDFDLTDTRLKIHFDKKNKLAFKEDYATVSPPGINAYLPAVPTGPGQIAIGEDNTDQGGLIGANISLYAKMGYKVLNPEALINHFDLEIKTKMQFSPDDPPVEYTFTSAGNASNANHIGLCPRDPVYNPVYERFNIEREESTFSQVPKVRYPLYTQMTGKDFNVSIASYGGIDFEDPLTVNETTVELELIDAGNFDNNSSAGYDNVCEEPTSVAGSGTFIPFNNTDRVKVDLKKQLLGFNNNIALQSAAFRVWVLTKKDSNTSSRKRITVKHTCTDITNEECFQSVYNTHYKDEEDAQLGLCVTACGSHPNGCYKCLKEYFATPFCSRDNFSIRPESFRVAIADTNESTDSNLTATTTLSQNDTNAVDANLALAAGYHYSLDINATCFGDQKRSLGYYNNAFKAESNISNIAYITSRRVVAPLLFNDVSACTDKTHRTLGIKLQDGRIVGDKSISHDNVGAYKFSIRDSNWTNVDQASYPYKTIFDPSCKNSARPECSDCAVSSSSSILLNNKIGCDIDSNLTNREDYISLPLVFHPYAFGVTTTQRNRPDQNILFMNNLFDDYYGSVLSDHLSMSTSFEGNISALNKQYNMVSNFTKSCVASDVNLHLARTMKPSEDTLIAKHAPLQQYLEVGVDKRDSEEGNSKSLTLPKDTFEDENKGQVTIQLHTSLKKPLGYGSRMNPVQIRYDSLKASSIAQSSNAHMKADYIPEGKRDYDNNITYVYGKVTPENRLYKHIEEDGKRTPIYVDIFCDLDGALCADSFGLRTNSLGREEIESGWKLATIFDSTTIGTTDIEVQYQSEKNADAVVSVDALVAKKLAKDVIFNDGNATQNDINISVRNEQRNSMIKVIFKPVPWLRYEVEDYYRLHFVGPSSWAGVGKTGHVTDSKSSDTQNNRMNW